MVVLVGHDVLTDGNHYTLSLLWWYLWASFKSRQADKRCLVTSGIGSRLPNYHYWQVWPLLTILNVSPSRPHLPPCWRIPSVYIPHLVCLSTHLLAACFPKAPSRSVTPLCTTGHGFYCAHLVRSCDRSSPHIRHVTSVLVKTLRSFVSWSYLRNEEVKQSKQQPSKYRGLVQHTFNMQQILDDFSQ